MEGGFEMNCPKCGSSEYSIHLEFTITESKVTQRPPHPNVECDNCGEEWLWEC